MELSILCKLERNYTLSFAESRSNLRNLKGKKHVGKLQSMSPLSTKSSPTFFTYPNLNSYNHNHNAKNTPQQHIKNQQMLLQTDNFGVVIGVGVALGILGGILGSVEGGSEKVAGYLGC